MKTKHTAGPWRWEFNAKHKSMHLVGGVPRYDLTIMDFKRWGMGGAVIRLRDLADEGMNVMHRLCDRPDWIVPFDGRRHHADWCANVAHPDMRLIAAAPDLLEVLQDMLHIMEQHEQLSGCDSSIGDAARAAISKATGA